MLKYQLITSSSALKEVCERASACPYIALDTEFVRTRTYYPQLGLVQLYDGETLSLIDPLPITGSRLSICCVTRRSSNCCTPAAKIWRSSCMISRLCLSR